MTDRIEADYLIETPADPAQAAAVMAGEQSSGTFVTVPGETDALHERAAARLSSNPVSSLPLFGPWRIAAVTPEAE